MTWGMPGPWGGCSGDPQTQTQGLGWAGLGWRPQDWTFWLMWPRKTRPSPAGPGSLAGRQAGRRPNPGPLSDLLHVVSWEEALLAVQPAFPPA